MSKRQSERSRGQWGSERGARLLGRRVQEEGDVEF